MANEPTAPLPAIRPDDEADGGPTSHHQPDTDWTPVPRVQRSDGWTIDRQRRFIQALADCGSVTQAAAAVGMAKSSAYALRRAAEATGFAAAWECAIRHATGVLLDECMERAIEGVQEPVFDRNGRCMGTRRRFDTRLALGLLRAYRPDAFARRAGPPLGRGSSLAPAPDIAEALEKVGIDPREETWAMIADGEREAREAEAERDRLWQERFGD